MIRTAKRWFVTFHETELPVSHTPYWVIEVEAKTKYSAIMQAQREIDQDCGEYEYRSVVDMTGSEMSVEVIEKFLNRG
jgi:hypothetical protein